MRKNVEKRDTPLLEKAKTLFKIMGVTVGSLTIVISFTIGAVSLILTKALGNGLKEVGKKLLPGVR